MQIRALLTIFGIFLSTGHADPSTGCFVQHLTDAALVNHTRAPIYRQRVADAQGGWMLQAVSGYVSLNLITTERLSAKIVAAKFDEIGDRYQTKVGFHLTCDAFESMNKIGSMNFLRIIPTSEPVSRSVLKWTLDFKGAFSDENYGLLLQMLNDALREIDTSPYDCMLRHLLLSTRRFVELRVLHATAIEREPELAQALHKLISLHLFNLGSAYALDTIARPLHSAGIPIVCNDVPDIPSLMAEEIKIREQAD